MIDPPRLAAQRGANEHADRELECDEIAQLMSDPQLANL